MSLIRLILFCCVATPCFLLGQEEISLYPKRIPNSLNIPDPEKVENRGAGGRFISATSIPTLTIFKPAYPNGKAILICPGGGYRGTAFDKEGILIAKRLNEDSITAFVLKYRIPQDSNNFDKSLAPLQDAQQAIRVVRQNAAQFSLNPNRIGIMGFSAGGHLAACAATRFQYSADADNDDTTSVRPDFVALIYPVISFEDPLAHIGSRTNLLGENPAVDKILAFSANRQVNKNSPPAFLIHSADDKTVPVENSLAYYEACLKHGIPAEMHLYPRGGHGFGMYNQTTPDFWMDRLINWLRSL